MTGQQLSDAGTRLDLEQVPAGDVINAGVPQPAVPVAGNAVRMHMTVQQRRGLERGD
jgi:hypothetical protein